MFGTVVADLRYGMRMLIKAPGFAVVAILTIALGIGANSAMFSIVNAVLLDRLPFPEPDRLATLYTSAPQFARMSTSYLNFLDWAGRARSFESMAAFRTESLNLLGQGQPERLRVAMVSAPFFDVLGLKAEAGRLVALARVRGAARQAVRQRMDHRHLRREQHRPGQDQDSPRTKQLRRHAGRLAPPASGRWTGGAADRRGSHPVSKQISTPSRTADD